VREWPSREEERTPGTAHFFPGGCEIGIFLLLDVSTGAILIILTLPNPRPAGAGARDPAILGFHAFQFRGGR